MIKMMYILKMILHLKNTVNSSLYLLNVHSIAKEVASGVIISVLNVELIHFIMCSNVKGNCVQRNLNMDTTHELI